MKKANFIHPTAIVGTLVKMGDGNYIGPYCYITGETWLGDDNRFEAYCSIGTPPEHRDFWGKENGGVIMGSNNVVREFVTINAGTNHVTFIGSNCVLLRGSHIGHDATIHNGANISCNVLVGGHATIGRWANLGLGCIIHQWHTIDEGCMIGMGAVVTKKLVTAPYKTYVGNPARLLGENTGHPKYSEWLDMKEHPQL